MAKTRNAGRQRRADDKKNATARRRIRSSKESHEFSATDMEAEQDTSNRLVRRACSQGGANCMPSPPDRHGPRRTVAEPRRGEMDRWEHTSRRERADWSAGAKHTTKDMAVRPYRMPLHTRRLQACAEEGRTDRPAVAPTTQTPEQPLSLADTAFWWFTMLMSWAIEAILCSSVIMSSVARFGA